MSAAAVIARRDPAVIAGRAHAVLDAAARMHAQWPEEGRETIGRALIGVHVALEKYRAAAAEGDAVRAAESASRAMAVLLACVRVFLGAAVADEMARNAAEVAR